MSIILFLPNILTYYSSIILNSFRCLLFSKLCQHNLSRPSHVPSAHVPNGFFDDILFGVPVDVILFSIL